MPDPNAQRAYRAICFDLDGTLLPMDIDEFMSAYFKRIAAYSASHGLDPNRFMAALKDGTRAMAMSDEDRINKDVFWERFYESYGADELDGFDVEAMSKSFYEEDFGHIGDGFEPNPDVALAIGELTAKGYPLVLTTMPMFPLRAVKHRLSWAGVDAEAFERITCYENSKYVKPRQTYYAENLAALGLDGADVLMVGNNTMEDLSFLDLGADAYLITDWLLDPVDFDLSTVRHGTFSEFLEWVRQLPACQDPKSGISQGPVSQEDMMRAFEANAVREIDMDAVNANAKVLADAVASDHVPGSASKVKGIRS